MKFSGLQVVFAVAVVGLAGTIVIAIPNLIGFPATHSVNFGCAEMVEFVPKTDITTYELATIYKRITGPRYTNEVCITKEIPLPENLRRHFRVIGG